MKSEYDETTIEKRRSSLTIDGEPLELGGLNQLISEGDALKPSQGGKSPRMFNSVGSLPMSPSTNNSHAVVSVSRTSNS